MGNTIYNIQKIKENLEECEQRYNNNIKIIVQSMENIKKFEEDYRNRINNINDYGLCSICFINPKNGTIIHGDTAHTCCCRNCALNLYECPICRLSIEKVVTNFIS